MSLLQTIVQSLPGQPTRTSMAVQNLGREKAGLIIDLNKYRAGKNLKAYVDAGVDLFYLRMGGPSQWVYGDWRYQEDATWRPYMEQLDKLGMVKSTIGYIIHNPFEDWRLENNVHVDLINQWTGGGYMPGAFLVDHEVAKCWQSGREVTCTPFNLVSSLGAVLASIYKKWRKVTGVYTARWFTDSYGNVEHTTFFDNANKPESAGGPGEQYPTIWAWYPQQGVFGGKQYDNLDESLTDLLVPTGDQVGRYLGKGSYTQYSAWQFTDRLKITGDATGVDANVTRGTLESFKRQWGLMIDEPTPEPEPEPEEPQEPGDLAALEARVLALESWVKSYHA